MAEKRGCGDYELNREGEEVILRINCESCNFYPSVEDVPNAMALAVDALTEAGAATKIVFLQKREYEYDYNQVQLLSEIAGLYKQLVKQKVFAGLLGEERCRRYTDQKYIHLQELLYRTLKTDPIGTYVELTRISREERQAIEQKLVPQEGLVCLNLYFTVLQKILNMFEQTKIIKLAKPYIAGFKPGQREIYRAIFTPVIRPDFMYTKLLTTYPSEGEEIDNYQINGTEVTIFSVPYTIQYLYHMVPPEFRLPEEKYALLDAARKILIQHEPTKQEFVEPERIRQVFANIGADLLEELAGSQNIRLRTKDRDELAEILVRYTVGFGLIEVLLQDDKVQDVTINSPMGRTPFFIVHQDYGDCTTNIIPTAPEGESWASKLRMISGRPLDEANPILDTELLLPYARARVAAITAPLNPTGLAYAFRRHREKPWTLPLYIKNKMLTPLAAGVLSFLIDGARTLLVAGTRSAGKTSLLGSLMVELSRKGRIVTIEDTLELPSESLRKLGYNLQSLKVASALTKGTTEVSADEGIRTTLRLGDSSLIVGEVRSVEARALYEAMRIGALANVVAGTIHGDSPYGVFDRVVNDLGVQRTSFKATDIIVVANPIRSADGLHRVRRITSITEVRKYWENDPLTEKGFMDLFKYNAKTDTLEPTKDLLNGDSDVLKAIAANVKDWAGNWDAVWENITIRAAVKQTIVETAEKLKKPEILEADFVVQANDALRRITDQTRETRGTMDSQEILFHWQEWFKRELREEEEEKI